MKISSLISKLKQLETIAPNAEVAVVSGEDAFELKNLKLEAVVGTEDDSVTTMVSINVTKVA